MSAVSVPDGATEAEVAHKVAARIRAGLEGGRTSSWVLASALFEFREQCGWRALGYKRLVDWLADPEVGMSRSVFYRLVMLWRELVVNRDVDPEELALLDPAKVWIVLPAVRAGECTPDEALTDAREMGLRDLREQYRVAQPSAVEREAGGDGHDDPSAQSDAAPPKYPPGRVGAAATVAFDALSAKFGRVEVEARPSWAELRVAGVRVTVEADS